MAKSANSGYKVKKGSTGKNEIGNYSKSQYHEDEAGTKRYTQLYKTRGPTPDSLKARAKK